ARLYHRRRRRKTQNRTHRIKLGRKKVNWMKRYQPLDLLFYKGNSILARLIRYISKSEQYSHCSIFIDHLHLLETSWKQPNVIAHFGYRYTEYDVYRINLELTEDQKTAVMEFLQQRVNRSY